MTNAESNAGYLAYKLSKHLGGPPVLPPYGRSTTTRGCLLELDRMVQRVKDGAAIGVVDARIKLGRSYREATWRLNESEHIVQHHALGHYWQHFYWPFGSRRNASERMSENYLKEQPLEHQGDPARSVDFYWYD